MNTLGLFSYVLKKFFTEPRRYENKEATDREVHMTDDIRQTIARLSPTILQDAAGAAALVVMLIVGLHLPLLS